MYRFLQRFAFIGLFACVMVSCDRSADQEPRELSILIEEHDGDFKVDGKVMAQDEVLAHLKEKEGQIASLVYKSQDKALSNEQAKVIEFVKQMKDVDVEWEDVTGAAEDLAGLAEEDGDVQGSAEQD